MNSLRETICLKRYSPSNYEKNATDNIIISELPTLSEHSVQLFNAICNKNRILSADAYSTWDKINYQRAITRYYLENYTYLIIIMRQTDINLLYGTIIQIDSNQKELIKVDREFKTDDLIIHLEKIIYFNEIYLLNLRKLIDLLKTYLLPTDINQPILCEFIERFNTLADVMPTVINNKKQLVNSHRLIKEAIDFSFYSILTSKDL